MAITKKYHFSKFRFVLISAFIMAHSALAMDPVLQAEEDDIRYFCSQCSAKNTDSNIIIDDVLSEYRNSRTINLSSQKLINLPSEIGNITGMLKLNLYVNKLQRLSSEISKLTNLQGLDISCNKFEIFPKDICDLTSLTSLNASVNNLQNLPREIEKLTLLQRLELDKNKLKSVPMNFYNLTKLTRLDLHANLLDFISPKIGNLVNLKTLTFGDNPVISLPLELGNLAQLSYFQLPSEPFQACGIKWQKDLTTELMRDSLTVLKLKMRNCQKYMVFVHLSEMMNSGFYIPKEIIYQIFGYEQKV